MVVMSHLLDYLYSVPCWNHFESQKLALSCSRYIKSMHKARKNSLSDVKAVGAPLLSVAIHVVDFLMLALLNCK